MRTILTETVEDLNTFENARSHNIERIEKNITRKQKEVSELPTTIDNEISANAALLNHIQTQRAAVIKNLT